MDKIIQNSSGQSLVQVLISFGLMSIMATFFGTMQFNQHKQMKVLEQKNEILEYKNLLMLALQVPSRCTCQFNPTSANFTQGGVVSAFQFDSSITTGITMELNRIKDSCDPSSSEIVATNLKLSSGLEVDKIRLVDFKPTESGSTEWVGDLQVSFKANSFAGTILKNLTLNSAHFVIDNTTPSTSHISNCVGIGQPISFNSIAHKQSVYHAINGSSLVNGGTKYKLCLLSGYSFCGWNSACSLSQGPIDSEGKSTWTVTSHSGVGGGCAPVGAGCSVFCF